MLNHGLEWDKFLLIKLTYAPNGGLTCLYHNRRGCHYSGHAWMYLWSWHIILL